MYSRSRIRKIVRNSVCIIGLIILFVSVSLNLTKLLPGQTLLNRGLETLQENKREDDERNSRLKLFLDKEISQNGSIPLTEIRRPDNSGDSVKFIFINSYMRSGSSFLGRLLGFRSDSFYYYEPLHTLSRFTYTKGPQLCDMKKPSCENRYDVLEKMFKFLSDVFNCKLLNHSEKVNLNLASTFSGKVWMLHKCLKQDKELKDCLVGVEERCSLTKYRVIKVLRMSLADAALLLPKHPNLNIVHLFRDPRGTFNSHIRTGWFPMKMGNDAFITDIKIHCKRITEDLAIGNTLKTMYPGRVTLVQYEDIYYDEEKAKVLYKLLGMDLPPKSKEFLPTLYREDNETDKSNYLSGPFKYRTSLPFEYIKVIDNECKDALEMLGLRSYQVETDLHDREFNPVDGKLSFEL